MRKNIFVRLWSFIFRPQQCSLLIASLFMASCAATPEATQVLPSPTPTSVFALVSTPTPSASASSTPAPVGGQTLRLWLPPQLAATPETTGGKVLIAQLAEFEATQKWKVETRAKKISGQGSLVPALQSALQVAPSAAPDIIALDSTMLANTAQLWQPLTLADTADYYAFAVAGARLNNQIVAVPFAADTLGLAYAAVANTKAPLSWNDFKREGGTLWLPLGDPNALLTLQQYTALEPALSEASGKPFLDTPALAEVLNIYQTMQTNGILANGSVKILDASETWTAYREGRGRFAAVTFSTYLNERTRVTNTNFTVLPTRNGNRLAFATQWSYAIVTTDPARRAAALELIRFLTTPERLSAWTFNAGMLPPRKSVFNAWPESGVKNIAAETLNVLLPTPNTWLTLSQPVANAVQVVLNGQASPEAAAASAAETVNKK